MKFVGFAATYSPETDGIEVTNKHNYFMNGVIKENIGESSDGAVSRIVKPYNLYALADGSKSAGKGEDAAYLCMDMMGGVMGTDFEVENEEYFDTAHSVLKGNSLQQNGSDIAVDIGVLHIFGSYARAYNIGSVSIFHNSNQSFTKISGEMPEMVEIEEVWEEDEERRTEKKIKKNVPHIGYLSGDCEIVPYTSELLKLDRTSTFVIATESVIATVGEENMLAVLNNKKISVEEKAPAIIDLAVAKNPDGNYTVEVITSNAPYRVTGAKTGLIALIVAIVLALAGIFTFSNTQNSVSQSFSEFLIKLMYGDQEAKKDLIVEPWAPEVDEEEEKEEKEQEADEEQNDEASNAEAENSNDYVNGHNIWLEEDRLVEPLD